ncbi:hypothetical protein ACHHYP_13514 [Achlya hypogyna]|uniref:Reverse transcriptase domain-containing protein n=1 Tax=Achlya hypogyna TaxID=1202772 RepID=A0A1V9YF48_ACHHY|nr:hypothetical protein ACHHYP_13514 [Achlya hypogyna]
MQFDFHANYNEHGSRHFFRRPHGSKVPISKANVEGGVATDAPTVQTVFTAHWRSVMTTPPGQPPLNRARRRAVLRRLTQRLSDDDRALLDAPLTSAELRAALKTMNPSNIFFADDSTLLSFDLPSAVEQLEIVREFCDVSGARLNEPKCMTLVLNGHMDPADVDGGGLLNVLPSGSPVKYLGVIFGHALPLHHQISQLNDRFLASFQQWGCRARTIHGRRLLTNTMLLSQLWHVTAVTPVPAPMVERWQSMVNRFILGRKTHPTDRYRPLLHRTWSYDPTVGLRLPHIASMIRAQRLARLQLLMQGSTPSTPPWQELVRRQYQRTMGALYRTSHPHDFLDYYPCPSSAWLTLRELHPLWVDVWSQWAATDPAQRCQVPLNLNTRLEQPMWLTTDERMLTEGHDCSARLAHGPATRRWCLYGASNGVRCLRDLAPGAGRWPTRREFLTTMSHGNPEARVELGPDGNMRLAFAPRAGSIYNHLHRLYTNVLADFRATPEAELQQPATAHRYLAMVKERVTSFEMWPKGLVRVLAHHAPAHDVDHPMTTSTRATRADIERYVRLVRRTLRNVPPVQADVWLRLLYHMLPVNSRFAYLQVTDPNAVCCAYGCGAVETELHALHACATVQPMWLLHAQAWGVYGVSFDWARITQLDVFPTNTRGHRDKDAIRLLWQLLVGSALHLIWTQHNAVFYNNQGVLPPAAWEELSFLHWMASVRRWLRLQPSDCPHRASAVRVLNVLRWQRAYRPLWSKHPSCMRLVPTAITA